MDAKDFRTWRHVLGFNRSRAAEALGLSRNMPQRFEDGLTDIPEYIALACAAIYHGVEPYQPTQADRDAAMLADALGAKSRE